MKNYSHDNSKEFHNASLEVPPYADVGQVPVMPRNAPNGLNGNSEALVVNAKYGTAGLDGPDKIVAMGRSTTASVGGSGAKSLPPSNQYGVAGGGDYNPSKKCYGVSGIAGGGSGNGPKRSHLRGAGDSPS